MPEERSRRTTGKTRRRSSNGRRRSPEAENPTAASDDAQPEDEAGGEEVEESGGDEQAGGERSVTSELKSAVREAAIEVLTPVARKATTSAAKLAVTKGPDLVKDNVLPKVASAGGPKGIAEMVKSKGVVTFHSLSARLTRIEDNETQRLLKMEEEVHKKVISQHEAIHAIAKAVRKSRAGVKDPKAPVPLG